MTSGSHTAHVGSVIAPDRLTASERLHEIAAILAAGVMRLRTRQSRSLSDRGGESSVDFTPGQSGHANRVETVERDR
ncbi:hypothetical protein SAMN02982931_03610 [Bauldia litoralis]|uniref:Uncharacterized protein n=1 Tax=Bauldia litoralis TaxID=665467 RepID=A0A1G6DQ38_9HYPH|nr:hypothetical protein SAMN02982931_03610 [Bauldia litoralis]